MKRIYKVSLLTLIGTSLVSSGCKKFLDVNFNPSLPQEVTAEVLLSPIQFQMTNGTAQDNRVIWKVTQDMAGVSTDIASRVWEQHSYPESSDVGGVIWRMTYADLGINLENMIKDAVANGKFEYAGIGYAIKAWSYQISTDLYGPIILDEAYNKDLLRFKYQDQPDVYAKVREWGNLAIKYLNMPTSSAAVTASLAGPSGDQIYKGNKAKWKKFVYGLFALQYSHLKNKPNFNTQLADSVIKYVDLSFIDESESATVFFSAGSSNDTNPLGPTYAYLVPSGTTSTYYARPVKQILNLLTGGVRGTPVSQPKETSTKDPRLSRLLAPNTAGVYQAIEITTGSSTPSVQTVYGPVPTGTSVNTGKFIFSDQARYPIMTYSQLQFAKAEAAFLKGSSNIAFDAYLKGINGHMSFCNTYGRSYPSPLPLITTAEITTYLTSSEVAQSAVDLRISDIMLQKYIAQWGWAGVEQWSDLRKYRYDPNVYRQYQQLTPAQLSARNKGKYAYRFRPRYNSEYVWNEQELAKWGGLDADYMTKEPWFVLP